MQQSVADSARCPFGLRPMGKMSNLMASLSTPCKGESQTQEAGAQHSAQVLMEEVEEEKQEGWARRSLRLSKVRRGPWSTVPQWMGKLRSLVGTFISSPWETILGS